MPQEVGCSASTGAVGLEEEIGGGGEGAGELAMVPSISPSAIAAFKQCPKLFYYR